MKTYQLDFPDPTEVAAARALVADASRAATVSPNDRYAAWAVLAASRKTPVATFPPAASAALTPIRRAA